MKKVMQFLAMPLMPVLAYMICVILFVAANSLGIVFFNFVHFVIYIFLGGWLFSRLDDKKLKIKSAVFTSVFLMVIATLFVISDSDSSVYNSIFFSPLSIGIVPYNSTGENNMLYDAVSILASVLPVVLIVVSSLIFNMKNKAIKMVLIAVLVLTSIVFVGKGIYTTKITSEDTYIGEDGNVYTAYFDMNGVKYEDNSQVPYYDTEGNVYYWTYDDAQNDDFMYCGELTDTNGNVYDIEAVYVRADGYIFIDENNELEWREDIPDDVMTDWNFKDKNGAIYTNILCVEYGNDGLPYGTMGNEYRDK